MMRVVKYTVVLRDPADSARLCAFFDEVQVRVLAADGARIEVELKESVSPLHAQRELSGYVVTWNALNPGAHAELTGG